MEKGIYLIVRFNFPKPFSPDFSEKAVALHRILDGQQWIEEVLTASGGIGGGSSSIWIFRLSNYAAIDRLLGGDDPVSIAYTGFIGAMDDVEEIIREEIVFV